MKTSDTLATSGEEQRLVRWLEQHLGGPVIALERQARWRPAWFAVVEAPDGPRPLYVRGDRQSKSIVFTLEYEKRVLEVLEAQGLPVPHVYGMCPDPLAIVMDRMPGRADLSTAVDDAERRAVLEHYMALLAKVHAIDPAVFEAAGLSLPVGARAVALDQFERTVELYRRAKRRPEPLLEYMIGWARRHYPRHRQRAAFLFGDPGQFLFENGRVTSLIDFELAYLGDPLQDLAALQVRDTSEPLGDLGHALRHYSALTGEPLDANAFDYHAVQFAMITPLSMADNISRPHPTGSMLQYLEWFVHLARMALELMAVRAGVALQDEAPLTPTASRRGALAEGLAGAIRAIPVADDFAAYERDATARLADYLSRAEALGPAIARADLADIRALIGACGEDEQQAHAALEAWILNVPASDWPALEGPVITLFYRQIQRQAALLAPLLSRPSMANRFRPLAALLAGAS